MNDIAKAAYLHFADEFENQLHRKLTINEKEFLQWMAKNYAREFKWQKRSVQEVFRNYQ
ncbi:hypothetical protein [Virgibacillus siamensis]|uniref:hypothetical protein n=1 Tax=Virgibacillus siamensis TaxID=480071 RepID=UPI00158CB353|nr:hypothetical protein [Virgibacillus siamensis]